MVDTDVNIVITFKKIEYTVTVTQPAHGSASVDKPKAYVGDTINVTATPDTCFEIDSIKYGNTNVTGNSFIMPAENVTVVVTFKAKHQIDPENGKEATCEEDGYKAYYECSVCHKKFSDAEGTNEISKPKVIDMLGHDWDEGEQTKDPTCEETGVKTYHCKRDCCTKTKTETIDALGHDWLHHKENAPTKTTEGNIEYYECNRCGKLFDKTKKKEITLADTVIPILKHDLTLIHAVAATCTNPGNSEYYLCKDDECKCGKAYSDAYGLNKIDIEDTVIPALGHDPQTVSAKEPTCTESGYKKYYKCKRCNKLFSDFECQHEINKPVAIEKLGHDMQKFPYKAPSRDKDGHIEYHKCKRCNKKFSDAEGKTELTDAKILIPATGAAKLGEQAVVGGLKYKVTDAHTNGTGTVTLVIAVRPAENAVIPERVEIKETKYKVTVIGANAFKDNLKIKTVSIGGCVKNIGGSAFSGCRNLTRVFGGGAVETIGTNAFAGCPKLSSFSITSPLLSKIGTTAFSGDKKLKTIYIKNTTKLTKAGVKKSLKGSSVKTVKVKKSKVKAYKKYFKKSNSGRSVKVKK